MNPFVNFHQRGIELPGGCIDLLDALRLQHNTTAHKRRANSRSLADMEREISCFLQGQEQARALFVADCDSEAAVLVELGSPAGLSVLVMVDETDPLLDQNVRGIFAESGIYPLHDKGTAGAGGPMRQLRFPLPTAPREAAVLLTNLFRNGFGLSNSARLWFETSNVSPNIS